MPLKDTNNNDNNIYFILFNKYKEQISGQSFGKKIRLISECKQEKDYEKLEADSQEKLFSSLMFLK